MKRELKPNLYQNWKHQSRRALVILMTYAAMYFAIGSFFYGGWWYGFLWGGKFLDKRYIADGTLFLLNYHPLLTICTITLLALPLIVFGSYRKSLFSFVDRASRALTTFSILCIVVASITVYKNFRNDYAVYDAISKLMDAVTQFQKFIATDYEPTIVPPVAFSYMDASTVNSLYSQIIPELVEKERSIQQDDKQNIEAGASVAGAAAKIGKGSEVQTKSSLQRVEFSNERKCIELINYSIKQHRAAYYSTSDGWFALKALRELSEKLEVLKNNSARVPPGLFDNDLSSAAVQKRNRELHEKYGAELSQQMKVLTGLVLLRGDFTVSEKDHLHAVLKHRFSEAEPGPIDFVIRMESCPFNMGEVIRQLSVFARIERPLDNGVISARAIAVF